MLEEIHVGLVTGERAVFATLYFLGSQVTAVSGVSGRQVHTLGIMLDSPGYN